MLTRLRPLRSLVRLPFASKGSRQGSIGNQETADFTKTRGYALTDLAAKVISSTALVVLGIAGWLLQQRAQDAAEKAQKEQANAAAFEAQEQRYLPMLRSLMELEVVLRESADNLRHVDAKDKSYWAAVDVAAGEIESATYSLFLPDGVPNVSIAVPPRTISEKLRLREPYRRVMPLRSGALMYAKIMANAPYFDEMSDHAEGVLLLNPPSLILRDRDGRRSWVMDVDGDVLPAFSVWLSDYKLQAAPIKGYYYPYYLDDLRYAVAKIIHSTLQSHAELGDQYVSIRSDVLRAAAERRTATSKGH